MESISAKNMRDHAVGEADPPIAAGIVGGLLVGEAGDERREQVDVPSVR